MRFACVDCNSTTVNQTLRQAAVDMSSSANHPAYLLSNLAVSKYMNGRTLICEARFQAQSGQQITIEARVTMDINYFERPVITDSNGNLPLTSSNGQGQSQGKRFYIQRSSGTSKTLNCRADSNPAASSFSWTINGQQIETGQTISVGSERIGYSIQCNARSSIAMYPDGRDSDSVRLDPWGKKCCTYIENIDIEVSYGAVNGYLCGLSSSQVFGTLFPFPILLLELDFLYDGSKCRST